MRAKIGGIIAAAFLASATLAPAAFAATHNITGNVKTVDVKTSMLTLKDGKAFVLPKDFKDPGLKAGVKVKITYDMKAGKRDASKVVIVK